MNRKVYIASCYFQQNYGSALQAYATQKALTKLNVDNQTICCDKLFPVIKRRKIFYYIRNMRDSASFEAQIRRYGLKLRATMDKRFRQRLRQRKSAFDGFVCSHFNLSQACSFVQLTEQCENADAVLVGSDQLWLPSNIAAGYYTLEFVPDYIKKISYATSFGISKLNPSTLKKASKFLNRFQHISVRERSGQDIVQTACGKNSPVVCDPTLLLDISDWEEIEHKTNRITEPYIFSYLLGNNPWHRGWVSDLRKKTGLKVVALTHLDEYFPFEKNYADIEPYNVDPGEFLSLIKNARYVCTDSFHCTMFSVLYERDFFLFKRFHDSSKHSTNSRLDFFTKFLKLENRMVQQASDVESMMNVLTDYSTVKATLAELKRFSWNYLKTALLDEKGDDET